MRRLTVLISLTLLFFACKQGTQQQNKSAEQDTTKSEKQAQKAEQSEDEPVELDLPRPSPKSTLTQRVGLTNIKISYFRPSVRGRKIWGNLVPYNEMWRTGANKATAFYFGDKVTIAGTEIDSGKYSFFTIPGKDKWTLIFNKKTEMWGTNGYKKSMDVLRFKVKPFTTDKHYEMMTFDINEVAPDTATIALKWKETGVRFGVSLNTHQRVMAHIEKGLQKASDSNWNVYASAADYCVNNNKDLDKGLKWINKSIDIKEHWYNHWVKAELLAKKGNFKEAAQVMGKAIEIGKKEDDFPYKDRLKAKQEEWQKKAQSS